MQIQCPYCSKIVGTEGFKEHLESEHEFDPTKNIWQHKERMLAVGININDYKREHNENSSSD